MSENKKSSRFAGASRTHVARTHVARSYAAGARLVAAAASTMIAAGATIATATSMASTPRTESFQVRHELHVVVPEGARTLDVWFAYPQNEPGQKVDGMKIESPFPYEVTTDESGNQVLFVRVTDPATKEFKIVQEFELERMEVRSGVDAAKTRPITDEERAQMSEYLSADTHVVIDDEIRRLSAEIVDGEQNPVLASRRIYDWVLTNIDYWVKDPENKKASPVGSTSYCLTSRTGNCTDFHSLWTSLARAAGIPTRMVYGSFLKAELNGQDRDQSYHCWPEFWAPEIGWIPHDVAVADIFVGDFVLNEVNGEKVRLTTADGYSGADAEKVDYYFGNLDERRVTWSRGRDLTLVPPQAGGPVNALAKAYVEVDGKPGDEKAVWNRKLTFVEK